MEGFSAGLPKKHPESSGELRAKQRDQARQSWGATKCSNQYGEVITSRGQGDPMWVWKNEQWVP